jgi:hypothetical protein
MAFLECGGGKTSLKCEKLLEVTSVSQNTTKSVTLNKKYKKILIISSFATWQNGTYNSSFSYTITNSPIAELQYSSTGGLSNNTDGHIVRVFDNIPANTVISITLRYCSGSVVGFY